MDFKFEETELPGVVLISCDKFSDARGYFSEVYKESIFSDAHIGPFVQENYSLSVKNVTRGLHYQAEPMSVGKLISCPHGSIFDVAVNIRPTSKYYGQWTARVLSEGNAMLWIPPGYAHGFQVLSDTANVMYRQTQYYNKEYDRVIRWNDPDIGIKWPINNPLLSFKDTHAPLLKEIR